MLATLKSKKGKIDSKEEEEKMMKILKENRRLWMNDKETLKQLFLQLKNETPSSLILNNFISSSLNSFIFYEKISRFTQSIATMSMVGYLIGLGDRHLDNILLDSSSAQITHIDFNICFDKGETLKVPEVVPFRLTQNILRAMGPFDSLSTFREHSQQILSILQKNKETILMLLEVFVYDPIQDWIPKKESSLLFSSFQLILEENLESLQTVFSNQSLSSRNLKNFLVNFVLSVEAKKDSLIGNFESIRELLDIDQKESNPETLIKWKEWFHSLSCSLSLSFLDQFLPLEKKREEKDTFSSLSTFWLLFLENFESASFIFQNGPEKFDPKDLLSLSKKLLDSLLNFHSFFSSCKLSHFAQNLNLEDFDKNFPFDSSHPIQTKNQFALKAIKKVKKKLTGIENSKQPMSLEEHLTFLIEKSTKIENLSNMYEGWSSWI